MAEAITIEAEARDPQKNKGTGTRVARRLRLAGKIPGIVYGHKQAPTPVAITRDDVWRMIKHTGHLAQLKIGGANETVLIRDVQWDHLGQEILHLDFARVSADETIETEVTLVPHGTPIGVSEGGRLELLAHSLTIKCRANAIPDVIRMEVSELHLNQGIHVRDLTLPEGVTAAAEADVLLAHVTTRAPVAAEPVAGEATTTEPEVIGRKAEDKDKEKDKDKDSK